VRERVGGRVRDGEGEREREESFVSHKFPLSDGDTVRE